MGQYRYCRYNNVTENVYTYPAVTDVLMDIYYILFFLCNHKHDFNKLQVQSKKNNPEKLTTQGTQDEDKQKKNTGQYVLDTTIRK